MVFIAYTIGVLLWASTLTQFDTAFSAAVLIIFTVLALVGYPIAFESATRGRTLGKMALGLRVVSEDGGPERFRQALFRALAAVIEIWMFFGGPAVICSLLSPKGKRIGDMFAGTVVISERAPRLTPPPPMPPQLAWWASSLQLSGLGAEQAELARQFLSRASQLDAGSATRWRTGSPATSSPRYRRRPRLAFRRKCVLAAVLAERHRRELARLRPCPPRRHPVWPARPVAAVAAAARPPAAGAAGTARPSGRRRLHSAELAWSAVAQADQHQRGAMKPVTVRA